jgi:hypothetical protein
MKITKFGMEYRDVPILGGGFRKFKLRIYTDTYKDLNYEFIVNDDDFTSLIDKLFDDAKYQIKELLKESM